MGKQVQVNSGYSRVWLYAGGVFDAGQTATLTDAEYAALGTVGQARVTVTNGSVADPVRPGDPPASLDTLGEVAVALGGDPAFSSTVSTALAGKVSRPDVAANDGQGLVWSATLGKYIHADPPGAQLLASAINTTGTVTTASAAGAAGAIVVISGLSISVPNSSGKNVVVRFGGVWQQTVAGDGVAMLLLRETTGAVTTLRSSYQRLPNTVTVPSGYFSCPTHDFDIGVVTTTRTFILAAQLWSPAANSPTATLLNTAVNPTFMRAVAGV